MVVVGDRVVVPPLPLRSAPPPLPFMEEAPSPSTPLLVVPELEFAAVTAAHNARESRASAISQFCVWGFAGKKT
ncbi:hypothetical protein PIB30_073183, partial [Stylosanthes scabra]|nr:hypothetical protein [Stylosanthes scabra]